MFGVAVAPILGSVPDASGPCGEPRRRSPRRLASGTPQKPTGWYLSVASVPGAGFARRVPPSQRVCRRGCRLVPPAFCAPFLEFQRVCCLCGISLLVSHTGGCCIESTV
ncbi:hypothetical protein SKAU_G00311520 [Synaphobranchus kaupii]|uniref:Uncharacterized protein n=1 Tax=Synaphobranchus kaupii TaxID=118154 RepID=A0A9Q1ERQ9_SYNKA|nr:hypothetical protein SKAU_G00311520 [Synaphobranchus kaupii]